MKRSSSYLFTVPVEFGVPMLPRRMINNALKGTGFGLRLFGRNVNRKQFARSRSEHKNFRQNFPARLGTTAVVYLRDYLTAMDYETGELVPTPSVRRRSEAKAKKLVKAKFPQLFV